MEFMLKYGCNPNQQPASISLPDGGEMPVRILNGAPGYINFMDALHGWQLVRELKEALHLPAAASFKHVSPAGAAVGLPLDGTLCSMYGLEQAPTSALCCAYARARGADRLSSFGDYIALSDVCDAETAAYIAREVSDGIIAPGYAPEALETLRQKRKGGYAIMEIDPAYMPPALERREIFGITFTQARNTHSISAALLEKVVTREKALQNSAIRDLLLAMITLKYTQSNSVCYAKDGQAIGVGAGQQSRIHCTRLAGNKADLWHLRRHPRVLGLPFRQDIGRPQRDNAIDLFLNPEEQEGLLAGWEQVFTMRPQPLNAGEAREWLRQFADVSLASDAFFPFSDNIERAARSGVRYIVQPGGSIRDADVIAACDRLGITMAFTGLRLFHH